ncbi:unnamed protein product [Prunus brigantina]
MPTNSEFGEIEWNLVEFRVWGIQEAETVRFELRLFPYPNMFPQIMANDLTSLIANVNISEVKNSLFNIGGLKTPGVDGFQRVSIKTNGIYVCVSSLTYHICVNGELIESFTPRKGIRQGDPLSLYLFVLCIEKLSHIIVDVVGKHKWKFVKSSQYGHTVSRLFFADDLILFAEASPDRVVTSPYQARLMKQCLELFCKVSGQIVNFEKSAIYCSPNTCKDMATDISHICGSPLTDNLATLIQAVTSSIPVYAMQIAKIPISIYENMDRLNRKSAHLPGRGLCLVLSCFIKVLYGGSEKKIRLNFGRISGLMLCPS